MSWVPCAGDAGGAMEGVCAGEGEGAATEERSGYQWRLRRCWFDR